MYKKLDFKDEKQELIDIVDRVESICENSNCQNCIGMTEKRRIGNTFGCSLLYDLGEKLRCYQGHNGGEVLNSAINSIEISSVYNSIFNGYPDKKEVRNTLKFIRYILNSSETINDKEFEIFLEVPIHIPRKFLSLVEW